MSYLSRSGCRLWGLLLLAGWSMTAYAERTAAANEFTTAESNSTAAAQHLIDEALHREIYGQNDQRRQLLDRVLSVDPENAAARWHAGYVRHEGRWVKPADLPRLLDADATESAYTRARETFPETAQGQLELADWCAERGLADRERAHLHHVLSFDSNHAEARRRLGFELIGGIWVSAAERESLRREAAEMARSVEKFKPTIDAVLQYLDAGLPKNAEATLLAIDDRQAIAAMEVRLASHSEPAAQLALKALARMSGTDATLALARQSLYSQWPAIRKAAAGHLRRRPQHVYVPFLLSNLCTLLQPGHEEIRYRNGRLVLHRALVREREDRQDMVVYETAYERVAREGGDENETFERMRDELADDRRVAADWLEKSNRRRREINDRIGAALQQATGRQFSSDPRALWSWWNDNSELEVELQKPEHVEFHYTRIDIEDRLPPPPPPPSQRRKDCLTAGTIVWSSSGPVAVETIRVGDLVLSQHPETGQLAYKPVLRTSIRREARIVRLSSGGETIEASGGHHFWVSGEGWIKARELASGMELHTVGGTSRVSSVTPLAAEVETYNFEVADFHSYFVGKSQTLSHDLTTRQPTDTVVPGLVP